MKIEPRASNAIFLTTKRGTVFQIDDTGMEGEELRIGVAKKDLSITETDYSSKELVQKEIATARIVHISTKEPEKEVTKHE